MKKWAVNRFALAKAWFREEILELKSWGKWIANYLFPMVISWPLKFPLVKMILGILLILSILSIPLSIPIFSQASKAIEDWIITSSGQGTLDFIKSFLGFPTLVVISLVLIGNSFWAGPRRKVFECVAEVGLYAVRSGGKRLDFLERMCSKNKVLLGLGEARRILPIYVPRREEKEILDFFAHEKNSPNAIITGPSTAGKTRTALEIIYQYQPDLAIIWPKDVSVEASKFAALPKIKGKILVFADDISLGIGEGRPTLLAAMHTLLRIGENCKLLATKREDEMPEDIAGAYAFQLMKEKKEGLSKLFSAVAKEEGTTREQVESRFAGHPGSVVANLNAKKQHWDEMEESCKRILQAEKLLWQEGLRFIDIHRILGVLEDVWSLSAQESKLDHCLSKLEEQGFIVRDEDAISVYAGYRDGVVTLPSVPGNPSERLLEGLKRRNDGEALFAIAYIFDQEYSAEYQSNPREVLHKLLDLYTASMQFYAEETAPLDYALTQNNLGGAYDKLAGYENPTENLRSAIAAFEQALRIYTEETAPIEYAITQNNLGNAYSDLAGYENPAETLRSAIAAYQQALRFLTEKTTPLDYAMTQNNLGTAYGELAGHENPAENLRSAIAAYQQALRFRIEKTTPLQFAMTQHNLGAAFGDLARHENPEENLSSAIAAYQQALRFRTEETAPLNYALTQNNLGTAYGDLAGHENPAKNLGSAIAAYQQALRFLTEKTTPLDYAMTQNNLGNAYGNLASHENPAENLRSAIAAYQQALRFYTEETASFAYAMTQNNLGNVYATLARHENPVENLKSAIAAYQQALRFRTEKTASLDYALTQNNLGNAYGDLARHENPPENFRSAIAAYQQSLRFRTEETAPLDYAMTQNNLGITFSDLARHENPAENLRLALEAERKALKVYQDKLPNGHILIKNLEVSILSLANRAGRQKAS